MKSTVWLIVLSLISQLAFSQSKGNVARGSSDYFEYQLNLNSEVKGNKNLELEDYIVELFPGETFDGWYYYWATSSASSCNLKEVTPVDWLAVSPNKFTSTGCNNIIPVKYYFQAPLIEGVYETILADSTKTWDSTRVKIIVTKSPEKYVRRRFGINKDHISYKSYFKNDPFNWSDNNCIKDYRPADSIKYDFIMAPLVDWLKILPSTGKVFRSEKQILQNTLDKKIKDSTWVTLKRDYYSFPAYYHYVIKETEPKDYLLQFNGQNMITTGYYPGSSTRAMMFWVRFDGIANQAIGVHDGENHRFYLGIQQDNSLYAGMGDYYTPLTSLNLIPGKWYNMAMTTSGGGDSAIVYINATEVSRWKFSFSGESKANFYIAARNDASSYGYYIKGLIEEVQVWEKPLSRNEIIKYMFTPPKGDENGLAIYYSFSEGWGDFTQNAVDNYYYGNLIKDPVWIDSIKRPTDPSIIITSVEKIFKDDGKALMLSCKPNPFTSNAEITFNLPGNGKVLLQIFDLRGILIGTLLSSQMQYGPHSYLLNNEVLNADLYILKLVYSDAKTSIGQSIKLIRADF